MIAPSAAASRPLARIPLPFGGSYEMVEDQITMTLSEMTAMDCQRPDVNEIESAFFTALQTFESYSITDDELRIRYADGELLLRRLVD